MAQPVLEFREVVKRFGAVNAVDGVSFSVQRGEIFTLLGPSGCGKTTTLRLVAGLEEPDGGEIHHQRQNRRGAATGTILAAGKAPTWNGVSVLCDLAAPHGFRKRRISVARARESDDVIRQRVTHALEIVGLGGFADRGATQLSGGQQQRVALARALVYEPAVSVAR